MTIAAVKDKLHDIIDHVDEKKIFELLLLFENNDNKAPVYDEGTLNILRKRSEQYLSGKSKNYTVEESMERIKNTGCKMAYDLFISTQADSDIFDAIDYYDKINPLLSDRFLTELFDTFQKIRNNPQLYSYISSNSIDKFRDIKLRSFPYVVIF